MITDPLFYRLFESNPEAFFLMLGMSAGTAGEMAKRYQYQAIEFKTTSQRTDGVFLPKESGLPLYFLEVQFYYLPSVFANLLAKVYTYLKQNDPGQRYCGAVLFATRSLEPTELDPYQPLMDAGLIRRFYLDEMPEFEDAPLSLSILYLIRETEAQAPMMARSLIARVKKEVGDDALRADLVELIETVIIYKLPRLSREEIEKMLQVNDIRESLVYQEGKEEGKEVGLKEGKEVGLKEGKEVGLKEGKEVGLKEGKEVGLKEGIALAVLRMAANRIPTAEIAKILELDEAEVAQAIASAPNN